MTLTPVLWLDVLRVDEVWVFSNWDTSDSSVVMTSAEALAASSAASFVDACASVVGVLVELLTAIMTSWHPKLAITRSLFVNDDCPEPGSALAKP